MTFTILVTTDPGCEDACRKELARFSFKGEIHTGFVSFQGTLEDACNYAHNTHIALRVLVALPENIAGSREAELIGATFKVSGDVSYAAERILDATPAKVDLDSPETVICTVQDSETTRIGVDIGGELGKRDWRVMLSRRSLRATIAAAAAIYADVKPEHVVLDPLCDDGTLAIETTLLQKRMSPRAFARSSVYERWNVDSEEPSPEKITPLHAFAETFHDLKAVKMNSKLAGCAKDIVASKVPLSWADMKFDSPVDHVLAYPPASGRAMSEKKVQHVLEELFSLAETVLGDNGTMTCIAVKPQEVSPKNFAVIAEHDVRMGKMPLKIIIYRKKKTTTMRESPP